jgi:queuine tRNA-ribosyltransferase
MSSESQPKFTIIKELGESTLARAGEIHTPHGVIPTPAFIPVGTKATVKAVPPDILRTIHAPAVLANTYHLYLEPGEDLVKTHGGFPRMMDWSGPSFTDSGGFQVFSLGAAMGHGVGKIATSKELSAQSGDEKGSASHEKLAQIDDEGVTFRSVIDGSSHRFTPERSMEIQHALGADIFFAFDECTSPLAPRAYQEVALARTHAWAKRSLAHHRKLGVSSATGHPQALYGVVQGGAYEDLRRQSARTLGSMDFDGYGIGGSFTKEDIGTAVRWVNEELPHEKPRHLLGIGEVVDLFLGVEHGVDTFDCVAPTRVARNGALYTPDGRITITNARYRSDMTPVCEDLSCPAHAYTKSYLAHLFRAEEMYAATIASVHNLHFMITLMQKIRQSLLDGSFLDFKTDTLARYYASKRHEG